jgi:hypothetical protein
MKKIVPNSKIPLEKESEASKKPKLKPTDKKSLKNWKNNLLDDEEEDPLEALKPRESILDYFDDDDEEE